ncbi:low molecular weight phosphotyrosine protein phosphatase [Leptolyngbya sp. Heron Island J]|uniref:low molecular weight protein tyrosine phosphatase family protein n=1 Tax=Leptolyngbya sp. Heron Island J TaxID=1385935 RepID=UPI0003B9D2A3|nr:low molecular weight phosphotyrosine protein phosphatase [Leptolyngbya sp. Heron Island J]ESA36118.1 low molecular weight phosphotyrosine protein phosphatase [Leptolyngbya sp. Heron Island J]
MNILFICSRNQWRSPTAEKVWSKHPAISVRSAGTSPKARKTVSAKDIQWADTIFAMEQKHKDRLKDKFTHLLSHKSIHVLDIPDKYQFMEPELVELLQYSVGAYLGLS